MWRKAAAHGNGYGKKQEQRDKDITVISRIMIYIYIYMDQSLNQTIRSTVEPGIGSGTDNDNNIYRISHRTRDKHIYITKVKIKAYKRMKQLDPVISMKYIKNDGEQSWNMQKAMEKRQGTPLCFGEMKRKPGGRQRFPSTIPI